jgi:hypothetical protein
VTRYTIRPTQFLRTRDHLPPRLAEFALRRLDKISLAPETILVDGKYPTRDIASPTNTHLVPTRIVLFVANSILGALQYPSTGKGCTVPFTSRSGCFADMRPRTASTVTFVSFRHTYMTQSSLAVQTPSEQSGQHNMETTACRSHKITKDLYIR